MPTSPREQQERQIEVDRAKTQDYINSRIQPTQEAEKGQERHEERQQERGLERDRD